MRPPLKVPVSMEPDPVIDAFKAGIDVSLLDENLKLTVAGRIAKLQEFVEALDGLRAGAEVRRERAVRDDAARAR